MTSSLIKAAAAAAAITAISASGAFAFAPLTGTFDYDTQIKLTHSFASPTVNWADAGDDFTVVSKFGNWLKVKVPGPDGWVKQSAVSLDYYATPSPYPTPSPSPVQACFWGPGGYICIN
jgi:hypothetical protein